MTKPMFADGSMTLRVLDQAMSDVLKRWLYYAERAGESIADEAGGERFIEPVGAGVSPASFCACGRGRLARSLSYA